MSIIKSTFYDSKPVSQSIPLIPVYLIAMGSVWNFACQCCYQDWVVSYYLVPEKSVSNVRLDSESCAVKVHNQETICLISSYQHCSQHALICQGARGNSGKKIWVGFTKCNIYIAELQLLSIHLV